ncbi:glycosyltransferase family 4 protein [uncultured Mucilaginibacter sp.]|uniref:glycosyltransferase family 4 protein n=1 Tax=uncultured Mucilaginibacter sp. TaxID=797541 RepID=UPI002623089A|nr:glycosyltransferase family 4 protein [uncultured Mucilaginibacter sp.]
MKGSIANPGVGPHVRETLKAYQEHNILHTFYTTLYQNPRTPFNNLFNKYLPQVKKQLERRQLKNIESLNVKSIKRYELLRIVSSKAFSPVITDFLWEWGELAFDKWVAKQLNNQIQWIHGYEHCSLATLQQAKNLGIKSFYEQPSQHFSFFEKIAKNQFHQYPELINAETNLLIDRKSERRNQRRTEELDICDYIICNSTFTKKTLTDVQINPNKIINVPLGFPSTVKSTDKRSITRKTIFIYAGNQSLRKGTHILYKAWQKCNFKNEAELWLVGSNQLPIKVRQGLGDDVKFLDNLPHESLMQLFSQVDMLVLPTLCDGFGMVITEAMSQSLPVITTYNSGGPDLITEGKDGFLLEAGNVEQLADKLKWCVENKDQLLQMGENALEKAASYPWASFRKQLIKEITSRIDSNSN